MSLCTDAPPLSLFALVLALNACGDDSATGGSGAGGTANPGGESQGGMPSGAGGSGGDPQAGEGPGGSGSGGNAQGGRGDGGSAAGGNAVGGSAVGGSAVGGNAEGGMGGNAEGGMGGMGGNAEGGMGGTGGGGATPSIADLCQAACGYLATCFGGVPGACISDCSTDLGDCSPAQLDEVDSCSQLNMNDCDLADDFGDCLEAIACITGV
jgi:hypothetical protein